MDDTVIAALITSGGVIAAAIIGVWVSGKSDGVKPASTGPHPVAPPTSHETSRVEQALRQHPTVAARLGHQRDHAAAEAAILFLCRGKQCPVDGWPLTRTWQQIEAVHSELTAKSTSNEKIG